VSDDELLACCRIRPERIVLERLRAHLQSPAGPGLAETALSWDVGPLLGRHLSAADRRGEPTPDAGAPLVAAYRSTLAANVVLLAEAGRLLSELAEQVDDVVVFKGVDLATRLYPDPGMRPMCDCDVLVRPEAFEAAMACLSALGARRLGVAGAPDDRLAAWQLLLPGRVPVSIDLHRTLLQPEYYPLDHDGLWARSEAFELDRAPVRRLAAADSLVFTCLHLAKHGFSSLPHLVDVAELARRQEDWEAVRERAEAWRARTATWAALWLAGRLLDAPVPERLELGRGREAALGLLLTRPGPAPLRRGSPRRLVRVARQVAALDGTRARLRYLGRWGLVWTRTKLLGEAHG